jgi:small-conductance mechanosensitive channel
MYRHRSFDSSEPLLRDSQPPLQKQRLSQQKPYRPTTYEYKAMPSSKPFSRPTPSTQPQKRPDPSRKRKAPPTSQTALPQMTYQEWLIQTTERAKQQVELQKQKQQINQLQLQVKKQQQKLQQLLAELKQKKQTVLKETLCEKIANSNEVKQHMNNSVLSMSSLSQALSTKEYDQSVLLAKINAYLISVGKPATTKIGHCHGITLLWLTMMYLDLESLFYSMIKKIADCPDHKLHTIGNTITTFLDWIDLGQNPAAYSNHQYGQRDVAKIIGGVTEVAAVRKSITRHELLLELLNVTADNNMICFAGKGIDKANKRNGGHAIGVFVKQTGQDIFKYCVFDPNYKDNKHKEFSASTTAAAECWARAFASIVPNSIQTIEMDVVKPPSQSQKAKISRKITGLPTAVLNPNPASFFGKKTSHVAHKSVVNPKPIHLQQSQLRPKF